MAEKVISVSAASEQFQKNEGWLNRTWRPAAAVVYLAICLFDFIIAPSYMGLRATDTAKLVYSIKDLDPEIAIAIIQNKTPWSPLTLQGSGLFHVAFGAILGVAAWTRGTAQIESIRQTGESERSPYTPTEIPVYYDTPVTEEAPTRKKRKKEVIEEFDEFEEIDNPDK